ncbi:hypothetical protein [Paraburkholderia susongensis]|uniref:hypothetical protein n=1 Tax=Paraburkholderia susongensis TaxID=1515439 RepID=UPI000A1CD721|nr:hypothetical protein [Paraburkholderia susongensis]
MLRRSGLGRPTGFAGFAGFRARIESQLIELAFFSPLARRFNPLEYFAYLRIGTAAVPHGLC